MASANIKGSLKGPHNKHNSSNNMGVPKVTGCGPNVGSFTKRKETAPTPKSISGRKA